MEIINNFFLTSKQPCSYLDHRDAQFLYAYPSKQLNNKIYSQLITQGFRRSGHDIYKPYCQACIACVPSRINTSNFKANRTQKRCLKKNIDIKAIIKPPIFNTSHYELFLNYQLHRHSEGDMAHASPAHYLDFFNSEWCNTIFVEFFIDTQLAAVAIIDQLDNAWSAVYSFFDPKFSERSLGVYIVLWQIEQLQHRQLTFLYLGFWIKECKKMNYKSNFKPIELLINENWSECSML
jgi:arginine-tRNA-protein transferase